MRALGVLLFALCLGWAAPVFTAESGEVELRALLGSFLEGASRNDRATHARFWAEDLVYTSSAGRRFGKATILDSLPPEPAPGATRYDAEEVNVRIEGAIAVVTFRLVAISDDGSRQTFFNTGVFRRQDGEWRAFTWQATREAVE
jgi:ketosteroid isomerase-like protein